MPLGKDLGLVTDFDLTVVGSTGIEVWGNDVIGGDSINNVESEFVPLRLRLRLRLRLSLTLIILSSPEYMTCTSHPRFHPPQPTSFVII